jgi:cell filamentation protein
MESKTTRKAIYFDLDDNALKAAYPKPGYKRAWDDIKKFMVGNGFEHRQKSGYNSLNPLEFAEVLKIVRDLIKALPWLSQTDVIQQFDVTEIGETHSLSHLFTEENEFRISICK